MQVKLKEFLKRIPAINYLLGNFVQRSEGKRNATFLSYKKNFIDGHNWNVTKIDDNCDLYMDRFYEIKRFYQVSLSRLIMHYLRNGTPNTNYYKSRMLRFFDNIGKDKNFLKQSYAAADYMYAQRLMLRYHNYKIGKNAKQLIEKLSNTTLNNLMVLDYGCGMADPSLFLALNGANVTIVDLDSKKFEFAQTRFKRRNLDVTSLSVDQTEKPCEINNDVKFDLIIMAEFLEHVRSPRIFLEFAISHLKKGGLFYDSLGAVHTHGVVGDHLKEAKHEMETTDYASFFQKNFQPINEVMDEERFKHFYMKR